MSIQKPPKDLGTTALYFTFPAEHLWKNNLPKALPAYDFDNRASKPPTKNDDRPVDIVQDSDDGEAFDE